LLAEALAAIQPLGARAEPLQQIAKFVVERAVESEDGRTGGRADGRKR